MYLQTKSTILDQVGIQHTRLACDNLDQVGIVHAVMHSLAYDGLDHVGIMCEGVHHIKQMLIYVLDFPLRVRIGDGIRGRRSVRFRFVLL